MKVFRIQNRKGRGPWKPGFSHKWVAPRTDHSNLVPVYEEFDISNLDKSKKYGVGCGTIDKLKRWITEDEYKTLLKYGYKAVEIKADKIIYESDVQLLFERKKPISKGVKAFKLYP